MNSDLHYGTINNIIYAPSDLGLAAGTFSTVSASVFVGIPFMRYSTALSGLLKLARNAASTYSKQERRKHYQTIRMEKFPDENTARTFVDSCRSGSHSEKTAGKGQLICLPLRVWISNVPGILVIWFFRGNDSFLKIRELKSSQVNILVRSH